MAPCGVADRLNLLTYCKECCVVSATGALRTAVICYF
jgi:hypothetical protein